MTFDSFNHAHSAFLWGTFGIAFVMGAVVNKTNFCTMGAVSDMVNMGDTGRFRAWLFAIAIAMIGVSLLSHYGLVDVNGTYPPYRGSLFIWSENIVGGVIFGIGMTLASGCANKSLVRIGGGNIKSVLVLAVMGVVAYFMVMPFPGSDQTLMSLVVIPTLRPLAVSLKGSQDLGSMISASHAAALRLWLGVIIGAALLIAAFKSKDFRGRYDNILGGLIVGLAVLAAWYITSNIIVNSGGDHYTLKSFAEQWDFLSNSNVGKPADVNPLAAQSFTFVNPAGQFLRYIANGFGHPYLTFGVMALFGVIAGSLVWALVSRNFRFEWFVSFRDFLSHFIGGALMGFGGVLGMGCTIGQGITGVSTLAAGSFLTFFSIVFGSALTMKVQYYKMVYEDASFAKALVTSLVDMRLLPSALRKLEAV